MSVTLDLQIESQENAIPDENELQLWTNQALKAQDSDYELTIRVVDEPEIQALNKQYRQKDSPTNVLSFPANIPEYIALSPKLLGDIILCAPIIKKEAMSQNKAIRAHYAHMVIHGVLHLLGYDHIKEEDAAIMEPLEITLLKELGFNDPYLCE